ncbi:alpha/beta hydrolase-fold protein [Terrimonas rubra]|uniref:Alpha/beta hydrolase-fold protein n=1 Tax=Terrimonas rubra TaxID=1035890 RepID=A0ABW6A224_9BACT
MKNGLLLIVLLSTGLFTKAQDLSLFKKEWLFQSGDTLPYRILLPQNFDANKKYPLVLFLHGRGESGTDNEKQLVHGAKLFLADSNRNNFPAIVVFPQCPVNSYWSNVQMVAEGSKSASRSFYFTKEGEATGAMKMVMALMGNLFARFKIQENQVYVMGLSMGGMGTFEVVRRMPNTFAAAIPICGGANPATAGSLTKTSWWVFHGGKDDVVLPKYSEDMVKAMKRYRVPVKFTLYPEANHNSWDPAFAEPELLKWLFKQKKKAEPVYNERGGGN